MYGKEAGFDSSSLFARLFKTSKNHAQTDYNRVVRILTDVLFSLHFQYFYLSYLSGAICLGVWPSGEEEKEAHLDMTDEHSFFTSIAGTAKACARAMLVGEPL